MMKGTLREHITFSIPALKKSVTSYEARPKIFTYGSDVSIYS